MIEHEKEVPVISDKKKEVEEMKTEMAVVINSNKLNVRDQPNIRANILYTLKADEKVMVCRKLDQWYQIHNAAGIKGYAMNKFLKLI